MRVIGADVLMEALKKWRDEWDPVNNGHIAINEVIENVEKMPTVDAIPIQYILTTIRKWNRDGYAESAEALEILVMNWDEEKTEWAERKEE